MEIYTCPMHPEVVSDKPGKCPKCGNMDLVLKSELKSKPKIHMMTDDKGLGIPTWKSYMPLIVIISVILLTTISLAIKDTYINGTFSLGNTISYFMIGFFLTFATFKLMDLKGFAEGYSTYDLLASRVYGYGYIYPFIELGFGLAMILAPSSRTLLWIELLVMLFSGLGVAIKLVKGEEFICACLGTFLKVPLTKVTLIEDFGMVALAFIALLVC
jgi:hypothetical protein